VETRWPRGTVTGPVFLRGTCGGKQEKGGKIATKKEAKEGLWRGSYTALFVWPGLPSPHTPHIQRSAWGTARPASRRTPRVRGRLQFLTLTILATSPPCDCYLDSFLTMAFLL
jgi:hypothetical protein